MRFFDTAGPVNCQDHDCLPPLQRIYRRDETYQQRRIIVWGA